jgi:hypothetical protein
MQPGEDEYGCHAEKDDADYYRIPRGESAGPEQQATSNEADQDSDGVGEAEAVQGVWEDVDEKDSGEEAGDVVVPLHRILRGLNVSTSVSLIFSLSRDSDL